MTDLMNDEELESLLRSVPLHQPSQAMDARVLGALHVDPAPSPYRLWWRVGSAIAACVAIAALVLISSNGGKRHSTIDRPIAKGENGGQVEFDPVRIEESWSTVQPQGVVQVDETPLRQYLQRSYERVQLIDEQRNIRIEYTEPRNDLIVTPARFD